MALTLRRELPSGAAKRAYVRDMFDRIAARYDRLNRLMTLGLDLGWRRRALADAGIGAGDLVVDLASGTADLARLAVRAGARAVAADLSRGMIAEARRRSPELACVQCDGASLPFADGSATAVTCGFALRNFAAIEPVLAECARVLAPGGRLVLVEIDVPRRAPLRWAHGAHLRGVVPRLGALLSDADAYRYLAASIAHLPDEINLRAMLEDAGFAGVRKRSLVFGAIQTLCAVRAAGTAPVARTARAGSA